MRIERIGFIGGGNMTLAIAGGLLGGGVSAAEIRIAEPSGKQRRQLDIVLPGVTISEHNDAIAAAARCLVLATKPQVLPDVCRELAAAAQAGRPLIISIAAGVRGAAIDAWLGGGLAVVRAMPNQPAVVRRGVTALHANERCDATDIELATTIMRAVGRVVPVRSEDDIDAVTAISGSGPAYFYLLIDMLVNAAQAFGLDAGTARVLAVETALGSAALAAGGDETMPELIARVRSAGGTTAAALDSLEQQGIRAMFDQALTAARDRARELANEALQ